MSFLLLIAQSLYFFLPAYCANMAPVLFKWLPLGLPIHERLLGQNKTWRGLIVSIIIGGLVFGMQKAAYKPGFQSLAIINYGNFSIAFGLLMGAGAILGDLIKSFYKRKAGIPAGARWLPWDQLDFVFGGLLLPFFIYVPPAEVTLVIVVLSPFLHIIVNHIGYWLKIRKEKW